MLRILCGYYYLALRNKIFHRWNRFYLLASVALSMIVPLLKIDILHNVGEDKGTVIKLLQTISNSDEIIIEYSRYRGLQLTSENIISTIYILVTITFISIFFLALYKILRLKKKYHVIRMKEISFFDTDAKGTPFSFFNSIFWNNAIDIHSRQGQQIFNHEMAHVKEKHSYDKIFMNVVLLFFWMNPFFWIMRKELGMIHEFIADKEALEDSDVISFAEMILQTVYPGQQFSLTNNFFHSPLKRRIMMFTKNKNPKVNFASRLLVLPLAGMVFFAFTLKMKTITHTNFYTGKKITVVIDAGHGGADYGVIENNIIEKDINLAIAKKIKELNKNENINIVLSRSNDVMLTPQDRINFADANKADLFISIHMDAEEDKNKHDGMSVFIPKNDNTYLNQSKLLGSSLIETFKNNYDLSVPDDLKQSVTGIYVLKANQFPAVLIEAGVLTTQKDLNYLVNPKNQQTFAQNILSGIEKYAAQNISVINAGKLSPDTVPVTSLVNNLTVPPTVILYVVDGKNSTKDAAMSINANDIESVTVLKGAGAVKQYGDKARDGIVVINTKNKQTPVSISIDKINTVPAPLYIIDGKESSKDVLKTISPNSIESINVLKNESATSKYGDKGKNGVIEIHTKQTTGFTTDTIPGKVFTKVENEAEFPGGREALLKYIQQTIQKNADILIKSNSQGTCLVEFIVNTNGSVTEVKPKTMQDSKLAEVSVKAIKDGPKWVPANQNGQLVAAYKIVPVTFKITDNIQTNTEPK